MVRLLMHKLIIVLSILLVSSIVRALPIVDISESVGGGIGEFTVEIQSPLGETWYIVLFAAENEHSVLAGGDGAFVDNNIGQWTGNRFAPNEWQSDFSFEYDTPGGLETISTTLGLGNFSDLFGTNTFAHAYWPTSYLDFSAGGTFSLIGPNDSRGGFKFHTPIVASQWVALVQNDQGQQAIITGEVDNGGGSVPVPSTITLFGLGLIGLSFLQRKRHLALRKK